MKKIFLAVAMLALSGCASGTINRLPDIKDDNYGNVTIIRDSSIIGAANSYKVGINGNDVFAIRNGQFTIFKLRPGEYQFSVKCFGGWSPTWKEDSIKLSVAAKTSSYLLVEPNMSCAKINIYDKESALKKINDSEFIAMEYQP